MSRFHVYAYNEYGAALVEYAVALIVVTIIGGAAVLGIGGSAGQMATNAAAVTNQAVTLSAGG